MDASSLALSAKYQSAHASFAIGSTTTSSLVNVINIKGHLFLLNRFAQLRRWVDQTPAPVRYVPKDKDKKWAWFVRSAVERFDKWCRALLMSDSGKPTLVVLPPIDVIMVWHSYMLNPRWYAEDCMRLPACQTLKVFEHHFRQILLDDPSMLLATPSRERFNFWVSRTGLGWDPLVNGGYHTTAYISCPGCARYIQVDYMKRDETGYLQENFMVRCKSKHCGISITRETLALGKLSRDISTEGSTPLSHLAGTYFTAHPREMEKGAQIKRLILELAEASRTAGNSHSKDNARRPLDNRPLSTLIVEKYANSPKFKMLKRDMTASSTKFPHLIDRILSAYNDDKPYSVELVEAVIRQGSFVQKMDGLGWTKPGFFDDLNDEVVLNHALARYHAFLNLMTCQASPNSTNPSSCYVPTLDIDLVWHTHQLMPDKYRIDCEQYLGRFIDHNDRIGSTILATAFEDTTRAWNAKYRVQYTYCGCPVPGSTIGQRLSRIVRGYLSKPPKTKPDLGIPAANSRPEILSATHQSDHNAVHADDNRTFDGHECLMKVIEKDRCEDTKEIKPKILASDSAHHDGQRSWRRLPVPFDPGRVEGSRREEVDPSRILLIPIPYSNDRQTNVRGAGTANRGPTPAGSDVESNKLKKEVAGCGGCDGDGGGDCGDGGCGGGGGCGGCGGCG